MSEITTLRTPQGILHFMRNFANNNGTCRRRNVAATLFSTVTGYTWGIGLNQRPTPELEATCKDRGCPRGLMSLEDLPIESSYDGENFCTYVHAEATVLMDWDCERYPFRECDMYVTEDPCWNCTIMIAYARPRALYLPADKMGRMMKDAKRARMLHHINLIGVQL